MFFIFMDKSGGAPLSPMIMNDLRNLQSAALLFYGDNERWPTQGEEASLDIYMDRPIIGPNSQRYQRYAGIEISPAIRDASGNDAAYIKLTLNGKIDGIENVQRKLRNAVSNDKKEIFEAFPPDGSDPVPYKSGLDVVARLYLHSTSSDRSPEVSADEAASPFDDGESSSHERD
jgi:hypothetical protein